MSVRRLYDLLCVPRDADDMTLRRAYRHITVENEREARAGNPHAAARLDETRAAYEVLKDPVRRELYDEFGDASLRKGFDPARARAAVERARAEAARRAKAAMLAPTAAPRDASERHEWEIQVAIGPRHARYGGALRLRVTRPITCPRCDGSGRRGDLACRVCDGERRETARRIDPCTDCHGVGLKGERTPCPVCRGTGFRGRMRHKACAGSGLLVARYRCGGCDGRGLRVTWLEQPCTACRATGLADCPRCRGERSVPKALMFRFRVPAGVVDGGCYRYAGAGFSTTSDGQPTDLFVRFAVLARAPRR